ncbi:hypothetical protein C8Q76DRAFT_733733 [Earliella scabrosa]|nr:hypothetical protein C8Q76DRAFT_733733 [Earliella scabrosa]
MLPRRSCGGPQLQNGSFPARLCFAECRRAAFYCAVDPVAVCSALTKSFAQILLIARLPLVRCVRSSAESHRLDERFDCDTGR